MSSSNFDSQFLHICGRPVVWRLCEGSPRALTLSDRGWINYVNFIRMVDTSQITELIGFCLSLKRKLGVQRIDDNPIQIHVYPQKITLYVNTLQIIPQNAIDIARMAAGLHNSFSYANPARQNTNRAHNSKSHDIHNYLLSLLD